MHRRGNCCRTGLQGIIPIASFNLAARHKDGENIICGPDGRHGMRHSCNFKFLWNPLKLLDVDFWHFWLLQLVVLCCVTLIHSSNRTKFTCLSVSYFSAPARCMLSWLSTLDLWPFNSASSIICGTFRVYRTTFPLSLKTVWPAAVFVMLYFVVVLYYLGE